MYFSGHPLENYKDFAQKTGAVTVAEISDAANENASGNLKDKSVVTAVGIIKGLKLKSTKNDSRMAFATFEDLTGNTELIIFPKVFEEVKGMISGEPIVGISAEITVKEAYGARDEESHDEAKLILKSVFPAYPSEAKENEKSFVEADNKVVNRNTVSPPVLTSQTQISQRNTNPNAPYTPYTQASAGRVLPTNATLYLRLPSQSSPIVSKVQNLLEIFADEFGNTPVVLYFCDVNRMARPENMKVTVNKPMLDMLKKYIGDNNVVLKEKK